MQDGGKAPSRQSHISVAFHHFSPNAVSTGVFARQIAGATVHIRHGNRQSQPSRAYGHADGPVPATHIQYRPRDGFGQRSQQHLRTPVQFPARKYAAVGGKDQLAPTIAEANLAGAVLAGGFCGIVMIVGRRHGLPFLIVRFQNSGTQSGHLIGGEPAQAAGREIIRQLQRTKRGAVQSRNLMSARGKHALNLVILALSHLYNRPAFAFVRTQNGEGGRQRGKIAQRHPGGKGRRVLPSRPVTQAT